VWEKCLKEAEMIKADTAKKTDWPVNVEPLLRKYGGRKHPLNYANRYQLVVMVLLSAQDSNRHINALAPDFFTAFPDMKALANASIEAIQEPIDSVMGFRKKSVWLSQIAKQIGEDSKIPHTLEELTKYPGIGRKSANIIIRESGDKAEGIIVDRHVLRVAPRLGIAEGVKAEAIEEQMMNIFAVQMWGEIGMSLSFHGREICQPKPKCDICEMRTVCRYYNTVVGEKKP